MTRDSATLKAFEALMKNPAFREDLIKGRESLAASKEVASVWCAAALATFSAGGLAFSLGAAERQDHWLSSAFFFLLGVVFSFATFLSIANYSSRMFKATDEVIKIIDRWDVKKDHDIVGRAIDAFQAAGELNKYTVRFSMAAIMAIIIGVFCFGVNFQPTDATNNSRCRAVQQDLLSAHPRMANSADVFQALGCRPQGKDRHIFVAPTDRERAAGKPLPWGGYPPPL